MCQGQVPSEDVSLMYFSKKKISLLGIILLDRIALGLDLKFLFSFNECLSSKVLCWSTD